MQEQFRVAGFDLGASSHRQVPRAFDSDARLAAPSGAALGRHDYRAGPTGFRCSIEPASMPGRNVIQWDKEDVSDMGLIKVDLLGLGMMAVLKDCTNLIPQHYGKAVDIAQIPHDDRQVYASLR